MINCRGQFVTASVKITSFVKKSKKGQLNSSQYYASDIISARVSVSARHQSIAWSMMRISCELRMHLETNVSAVFSCARPSYFPCAFFQFRWVQTPENMLICVSRRYANAAICPATWVTFSRLTQKFRQKYYSNVMLDIITQ